MSFFSFILKLFGFKNSTESLELGDKPIGSIMKLFNFGDLNADTGLRDELLNFRALQPYNLNNLMTRGGTLQFYLEALTKLSLFP